MFSVLLYSGIFLFIVYWGWGVILYLMQPRFLYSPIKEIFYTPAEIGLTYEDVTFRSTNGLELNGWYIPSAGSDLTVLFCHGNGGNMMHCLDTIDIFYNLGLNCFIFDYSGYGKSRGRTGEAGTYLDAEAAYKWLTYEKKVAPENIVLFGRSLGGSIAAHLAAKVEAAALVVEGSFTSYVDIGRKFYPYMPVRWFARFKYRTIDYIKDVNCPTLFIYSKNDEVIPFEFGRQLYEAANEPKEFVEISGSHNDAFLTSGQVYKKAWTRWISFLEQYQLQPERQQAS